MYLASIAVAWAMTKELTPHGHALQWMAPLSMALLPGFTDLMTAVNNDAGAVLLFSLFLWSSARLIQRGFSLMRFLWAGVVAFLCLWVKETAFLALPLLGLVLLLSIFRNRWRWFPWALLGASTLVFLFTVFSWDDSLFWLRSPNTLQEEPIRVFEANAPLGSYVFKIENKADQLQESIFQLLPADQMNALKGKTVTLGAWVWATQPVTIYPFSYYDGQKSFGQSFSINQSPSFIAVPVTLSENTMHARMILSPGAKNSQDEYAVFYDGVVMAEGARPLDEIPQFDDASAQQGTWGGLRFQNLLRNASAESVGPLLRPQIKELTQRLAQVLPYPELTAGAILDWRGAGWYYQAAAENLLNTFWAKFGWGHVPLLPFTDQFYILLQIITLTGLAGVIMRMLRPGQSRPWNLLLFFGLVMAGILLQTFLRGMQSLYGEVFIPGARYAYPAIIPAMLLLNAGWQEVSRRLRLPDRIYIFLFICLDIAALASIVHYYYIR
jgi:hypothetical protein